MKQAFNKCKESLSQATILAHPNPEAELAVTTDASNVAIGAIIQQRSSKATVSFLKQETKEIQPL